MIFGNVHTSSFAAIVFRTLPLPLLLTSNLPSFNSTLGEKKNHADFISIEKKVNESICNLQITRKEKLLQKKKFGNNTFIVDTIFSTFFSVGGRGKFQIFNGQFFRKGLKGLNPSKWRASLIVKREFNDLGLSLRNWKGEIKQRYHVILDETKRTIIISYCNAQI